MEEKKFCTSCQAMKPLEGGFKKPNYPRGWRCKMCLDRKSPSIYQSNGTTTAKDVERLLAAIARAKA